MLVFAAHITSPLVAVPLLTLIFKRDRQVNTSKTLFLGRQRI
jgi:hypothetical protein